MKKIITISSIINTQIGETHYLFTLLSDGSFKGQTKFSIANNIGNDTYTHQPQYSQYISYQILFNISAMTTI